MTLAEFLVAIDAGTDTKILGKMIKDLPPESRKEAGPRFQALVPKPKSVPPKKGDDFGKLFRSQGIHIGNHRYQLDFYEKCCILNTGWLGEYIQITGKNISFREIHGLPQ